MYLNTKYIRFFSKVFKYKIVFCISNTYFKYVFELLPIPVYGHEVNTKAIDVGPVNPTR